MNKLFDKFAEAAEKRDTLSQLGTNPTQVVMERAIDATTAQINGKPTILAGTNNYLGLTFEPECIAAAKQALTESGTGTTGSRMANGNYSGHELLEKEIAEFYNYPEAMLFSTGYGAFASSTAMQRVLTNACGALVIARVRHWLPSKGCTAFWATTQSYPSFVTFVKSTAQCYWSTKRIRWAPWANTAVVLQRPRVSSTASTLLSAPSVKVWEPPGVIV